MEVLTGLLQRQLGAVADNCDLKVDNSYDIDAFKVRFDGDKVIVRGGSAISVANGLYTYLKKICNVNLSWCGNREIKLQKLAPFDTEITKTIAERHRVYMNYCTLAYSMSWWDWERWEKEIDFMALNGINMPLAVIGTEAVWYETLLDYKFTKKEALASISGAAFMPWQLMTNIDGYMPPTSVKYVYERLELGKKIIERCLEYGMQPIQQGFSGHIPAIMKEKFPNAKIIKKNKWCQFAETYQLDPLDPLFAKIGGTFLRKQKELIGAYHYYACDPFHENAPPKPWFWYLSAVGKAINKMYKTFDDKSVWVMQSWTMRKPIAKAVPKDRLLILDLNSQKTSQYKNMWGYPVVGGYLHNFGGRNAMEGKLQLHAKNTYYQLKKAGANMVGAGLFMEGIGQNPVIYDLLLELCTSDSPIDTEKWLDNYVVRRYGKYDGDIRNAWNILLATCYKDSGYEEEEIGSMVAARPSLLPIKASPCDYVKLRYDAKKFEEALKIFIDKSEEFRASDGYQFDLTDITRQALSNRFNTNQIAYSEAYKKGDLAKIKDIAKTQLGLMEDMDNLLSYRSELTLARWINDSHKLATSNEEKLYFDKNARTQVTLWGDIDTESALFDYAWKEWNGLIKEYYYPRWAQFYDYAEECLASGKQVKTEAGTTYFGRTKWRSTEFNNKLADWELKWCNSYSEYSEPSDKDVVDTAAKLYKKYF